MLAGQLERMKEAAMRHIKGNRAELESNASMQDLEQRIAAWRAKEEVDPSDLIELGTFAGKHDSLRQQLEAYLMRFEVVLEFNRDALQRILKELVSVRVADREKEREEEEDRKKAILAKQEQERRAEEKRGPR